MRKPKLTYAYKADCLAHISEVDSGLQCGCVCPVCGNHLIARKGRKTAHHFAHHNLSECVHAYQTSLHILAKEILSEAAYLTLPKVPVYNNHFMLFGHLSNTRQIKIESVTLERRIDNIIPDIVITSSNTELLIEIKVTHGIDEDKLNRIQALDISALEIDLSRIDREITKENLMPILIGDAVEKTWIYNRLSAKYQKMLASIATKFFVANRGLTNHIDYCPIHARKWHGKPYANVVRDCFHCDYLFKYHNNTYDDKDPDYILCLGKAKIANCADLKRYLAQQQST